MKQDLIVRVGVIVMLLSILSAKSGNSAEEPVVHALLFYSPTCAHCHKVITENLPPILEKYGEQLVILGINTYTEEGSELFSTTIDHYEIPPEMAGVPLLVIGDTVLIGSLQIPEQLPELVTSGLDAGGIDWPAIPGLAQLLEEAADSASEGEEPVQEEVEENLEPEVTVSPDVGAESQAAPGDGAQVLSEQSSPGDDQASRSFPDAAGMSLSDRFMQDMAGNSISTLVLAGMVLSVVYVSSTVIRANRALIQWPNWLIASLWIIGLAVAGYLTYVEVTRSEAVCGPVGDCNTVQQSPYAYLFGSIPIGMLGVVWYLAIGVVGLFSFFKEGKWHKLSLIALWIMLMAGTVFSIYLTILEPFVIGATCAWCLTSAVVLTLLLWAATASLHQDTGSSQ